MPEKPMWSITRGLESFGGAKYLQRKPLLERISASGAIAKGAGREIAARRLEERYIKVRRKLVEEMDALFDEVVTKGGVGKLETLLRFVVANGLEQYFNRKYQKEGKYTVETFREDCAKYIARKYPETEAKVKALMETGMLNAYLTVLGHNCLVRGHKADYDLLANTFKEAIRQGKDKIYSPEYYNRLLRLKGYVVD
ncbi:MAG: hypothetical protein COT14_03005 [Candidatus Diapherotrites archaeon CG08_land_8_20_14_0_20_30_16]|nr:MAG: hypothetical protein COT14_03005 [Candidatus Diapherotrites archaeon CG08_land_8_20_14_0_20_30_16]